MLRFLAAKHLPMDEYYDIVIFGYLRGAARYISEKKLQQYRFSTIAWRCMNAELMSHRRRNARMKRQAEIISIHSGILDSCAAVGYGSQEDMESRALVREMEKMLSPVQREILWLRLQGDSIREISGAMKIPRKNVQKLLDGAGAVLKRILKK